MKAFVGNALYNCAIITRANHFFTARGSSALYYILSHLLECLEFLIETTGEVNVASMLRFSSEDSIHV